ncbi:MAG: hypothetical protein HKN75_08500 [Bacteroidia bacterium]|nr:hypothetical protein [Bacteroidia bacterium]
MKPNDFLKRYQKQITLPQIGKAGQQKFSESHIVIIGCGGLGSIAAVYLAAAGIGRITLIDHDVPDVSNLHRQVFFSLEYTSSKVEQLHTHIKQVNPAVAVTSHQQKVTKQNINSLISDADVVLDCTDDLYAKYLINDACVLNNKALVYASIHQTEGYAFTYNPDFKSAHLRNFFPQISEAVIPSCNDVGVYNILAGMFGLIQANEAMKLLLNLDDRLENRMMIYNVLNYSQQFIACNRKQEIDVQKIWEESTYIPKTKPMITEIEATELDDLLKKENLKVISLLDEWEDEEPIGNATRLALGDFTEWDYKFEEPNNYLVYCQGGSRSKLICTKLNEKYPAVTFYTLKGGKDALQQI